MAKVKNPSEEIKNNPDFVVVKRKANDDFTHNIASKPFRNKRKKQKQTPNIK
ncbi:MAG: hypothetical protein Q8O88_04830 [bacterium]|nr:hypothetical protein [bacterium]